MKFGKGSITFLATFLIVVIERHVSYAMIENSTIPVSGMTMMKTIHDEVEAMYDQCSPELVQKVVDVYSSNDPVQKEKLFIELGMYGYKNYPNEPLTTKPESFNTDNVPKELMDIAIMAACIKKSINDAKPALLFGIVIQLFMITFYDHLFMYKTLYIKKQDYYNDVEEAFQYFSEWHRMIDPIYLVQVAVDKLMPTTISQQATDGLVYQQRQIKKSWPKEVVRGEYAKSMDLLNEVFAEMLYKDDNVLYTSEVWVNPVKVIVDNDVVPLLAGKYLTEIRQQSKTFYENLANEKKETKLTNDWMIANMTNKGIYLVNDFLYYVEEKIAEKMLQEKLRFIDEKKYETMMYFSKNNYDRIRLVFGLVLNYRSIKQRT